jgi:hypothetical protein
MRVTGSITMRWDIGTPPEESLRLEFEIRNSKLEIRNPKPEIRNRKGEIRNPKSENGGESGAFQPNLMFLPSR